MRREVIKERRKRNHFSSRFSTSGSLNNFERATK
jgi:hypothetical protein